MSRIRKVMVFVALSVMLPLNSFAVNQWQYVSFGYSTGFDYVRFIDANAIVATTSGSALNSGVLYLTTDGGATWNKKVENVAIINAIQFVSSTIGFAAGGVAGYGFAAYFGKTTDGGNTWIDLTEAFRQSTGSTTVIPLYGFFAVDENTLYAVGVWSLYRSTDGGVSWQEVVQFYKDDPQDETSYLQQSTLQFVGGRGFIASQTHLFRTSSGDVWEKLPPPWNSKKDEKELKTLTFLSADNGWALVVDQYISSSSPGTGAWLYKTNDGGATWAQVYSWDYSREYEYPTALYVSNTNEIWVGGWEEIWHSTDGGTTFTLENQGDLAIRIWNFQRVGTEATPRAIGSSGISGTSINGYYTYTGSLPESTTTTTIAPVSSTTTTIPTDTSTTTTVSGVTCPAEVSVSDSRDLALLRTFRDVIASCEAGKRLVTLYYRNAHEAADIIMANDTLRSRCRHIITKNLGVAAGVITNGHGVISRGALEEIKQLLRDVGSIASRSFADDITTVIYAMEYEDLLGRLGIVVK
ncbi:MAG: hypothetical protein N3B18_04655 [Desulfobacterota bacterium]|nr:hypothetical protein [Thermodesulfobacteriota bacterium]